MKWFSGSFKLAQQISKRNGALLVVFVDDKDEEKAENSRQMNAIWDEIDHSLFTCPVVAIHIANGDSAHQDFSQLYATPLLPATYFIDQSGKPIEIVTMLQPMDKEKFIDIVNDVIQTFSSSLPPSSAASTPPVPPSSVTSSSTTPQAMLEMEEKIRRAKEKLEKKRAEDAEKQRKEEKEKELERIQAGKMMLELQQKRQEKELLEAAEERRRDKATAAAEKERVKTQIKADREEREYRLRRAAGQLTPSGPAVEEKKEAPRPVASDRCRVQVRLPDGSTMVEEFSSSEKLSQLVDAIKKDGRVTGAFSLAISYPRKVFSAEEEQNSFLELCLTPSCALLVQQARSSSSALSRPSLGSIPSLVAFLLLTPLQYIWNTLAYYIGFGGGNTGAAGTSGPAPSAASANQSRPKKQPAAGRRGVPEGASVRRRGNMASLHNGNGDESEPEENPNWNGNSTQFL